MECSPGFEEIAFCTEYLSLEKKLHLAETNMTLLIEIINDIMKLL